MYQPVAHQSQPLFSYGLELAQFVVTSDLLHCSWEAISAAYGNSSALESPSSRFSISFGTYEQPNYTVVAFGASLVCRQNQGGDEARVLLSPLLEKNHPFFEFLCSEDNPSFSIHQEALTLFISHFDELSKLHDQCVQLSKSSPLIVTGHSMGGAVASLFCLRLLEKSSPLTSKLPLCITFGCPLIGDYGLQQAVLDRQTWHHRFLHVVSDQDTIAHQFISHQNRLLAVNSSLHHTSGYKPFGTYLLCSRSGTCSCFENPESVLKLMVEIEEKGLIGRIRDCVIDYVDYGNVLEQLKQRMIYKGGSEYCGSSSSLQVGIILQLEAIGLGKIQQQQRMEDDPLVAAMENDERENYFEQKRHISDPAKKLNEIKINMAYLEWYKKFCKAGVGYYDSYKRRQNPRDMDVIKYKSILTNYWEDVVREAKMKPQLKGISLTIRWLFAGTNYRRMVEPLDIADYYKIPGQKDYKTRERKHHYIMLERWQEEVAEAEGNHHQKVRTAALGLTEDSCFWAHVEEAIILCKLLLNNGGELLGKETEEESRKKLMEFENYVMSLIKSLAVSPEIFLEKSSFMEWWKMYQSILEPGYSSPLADFMKNKSYRQYA